MELCEKEWKGFQNFVLTIKGECARDIVVFVVFSDVTHAGLINVVVRSNVEKINRLSNQSVIITIPLIGHYLM